MDDDAIREFMNSMAANFRDADIDVLSGMFADPLLLYSETDFRATLSGEEITRMFEHFRGVLRSLGVAEVSAEVDEIQRRSDDRVRIRAIVSYNDPTGSRLARTVVRWYCLGALSGDLKVEIVEYIQPGLPGTVSYFTGSLTQH